jgi:hypothetical protein
MEGLFTIIIFLGVIAVTALVFGLWVFVTIVKLIARGLAAIVAPSSLPPMPTAMRGMTCPNGQCHAVNPGGARFCRRCGRELPAAQHVTVRRAAMW